MKRKLSPWCKAVKIAMIQKDWGVADLAQAVKMTKEYTSAVINGRVISEPAVKVISDIRQNGYIHKDLVQLQLYFLSFRISNCLW